MRWVLVSHAEGATTAMVTWDADQYLRFHDERTRACVDLVARVGLAQPARIVDLGCGPGNSTAVLRHRWPGARVTGVDSSGEMLARARADHPEGEWVGADLRDWAPEKPFDLVFSNATLHWLPDHARLLPRLMGYVAPGGQLAVQMPANFEAPTHRLMAAVAAKAPWAERLAGKDRVLGVHRPGDYYDWLSPHATRVEVWTTTYHHVLPDASGIVEWVRGTGLRPYLEPLSAGEQEQFLARYGAEIAEAYPPQRDGRVLLPFQRLFVIADR
jgi:trans-aconitate 2-methyltransferase